MNSLSWLLYLADAAGNLQDVLAVGAVLAAVVIFILFFAIAALASSYSNDDDKARVKAFRGYVLKIALPTAIVCALTAALMPSRNTIMLIAASEVGESVINSASAQELGGEAGELAVDSLRLLRKYVDDQLGETED